MSTKLISFASRQRGVGMVEAMVALVVVSIGMLGIAALYVESVRANRTALLRTQAINLANDMADRIRANRMARDAYALAVGELPALGTCVVETNCTREALAADDLARWVREVRATLPASPDGTPPRTRVDVAPAVSADNPDRYTIEVGWFEPGSDVENIYRLNLQLIAAPSL
jgi:type IV pilus modification protein PilV